MGTIIQFLRGGARLQDSVFEPHDIKAMSMALDDVCSALKLRDGSAREVIAARIIDLARRGERSPTLLRDRVLHEAGLAEYAYWQGANHTSAQAASAATGRYLKPREVAET